MYYHPAELIRDFIRYCDSQLTAILTELHMTEFCVQDRKELVKLVSFLEDICLNLLLLSNYKLIKKDEWEEEAFEEFKKFTSSFHSIIINGDINKDTLSVLKNINEIFDKSTRKGDNQ